MKTIIVIFLILTSYLAHAERIDGPANIREKPNGTIMASLDDNVVIYPISKTGDWYKIHLLINIKRNNYLIKENKIIKNSPIHTTYRNIKIGKTTNTIKAPLSQLYSEPGEGEILTVVLEGYTYKNNLKEKNFLEEDLSKILNSAFPVNPKLLKQHFKLYKYVKYWGKHNYFSGYTYNGDLVYDPSPTVRIIAFLCGEELCAISHQRPIPYNNAWKREKSYRGLNLLFLHNFPKEKYIEFITWYKKSFSWYD